MSAILLKATRVYKTNIVQFAALGKFFAPGFIH